MKIWRKVRAALEAGVNQRITRTGLVFTGTSLLVALAAFSSANNLLFLILAAMLATFMVSGLVSRLSLAGLALDLVLPEHICARRKMPGRIVIQNEKRWMASFSIHLVGYGKTPVTAPLYFAMIPGGAHVEQAVEVLFESRGNYRDNTFRFSTRFPFGFAERRIHILLRRQVVVYPSLDPLPGFEHLLADLTGEMESYIQGIGTDFHRIRPYEALESARHVDWRATAHTGTLQVREFARDQERSVCLFLDLNVTAKDEEWFERSVDCCAFLAWNLSSKDVRLRLRTQQFDVAVPEDGDIYTILKYLAVVAPMPGDPLPIPDDRNAFQVVFTLSTPQPSDSTHYRNCRVVGADLLPAALETPGGTSGRSQA